MCIDWTRHLKAVAAAATAEKKNSEINMLQKRHYEVFSVRSFIIIIIIRRAELRRRESFNLYIHEQ